MSKLTDPFIDDASGESDPFAAFGETFNTIAAEVRARRRQRLIALGLTLAAVVTVALILAG